MSTPSCRINSEVTFVEVEGLSDRLDGKSRPGHFRGVATVVAKLLIACEADRAFFGQKDAAQVAVLRRMAADLLLPVEIVVCPIVRDGDGLALSSRNVYLSDEQRRQALVLMPGGARSQGKRLWLPSGERRAEASCWRLARGLCLRRSRSVRVDYVEACGLGDAGAG